MFTGIIEAFARVNTLTQEGDNLNIELNKILSELKNEGKFDNIIYDRI